MSGAFTTMIQYRYISTSAKVCGARNFRKFNLLGKRGHKEEKMALRKNRDPVLLREHDRGVRPTGYYDENDKFHLISEMVPEIIVPDLAGFQLKPYVSYNVPDIEKEELTPQDLFYSIYANKIKSDFDAGELNEDGYSKNPSVEEELGPEDAAINARKSGSDIFG